MTLKPTQIGIILVIIVVIVAAVAIIATSDNDSPVDTPLTPTPDTPDEPDTPSYTGTMQINLGEAIEQDIVDDLASGSESARPNYVFYVVPFTLYNGTDDTFYLTSSDAVLTTALGMTYTPDIFVANTTSSEFVYPGVTFEGCWTYNLPVNHGEVTIEVEGTVVNPDLEVAPAPERELGQIYATFEPQIEISSYFMSELDHAIDSSPGSVYAIVTFTVTNVSYENELSLMASDIDAVVDGEIYEYDAMGANHPDFELIGYIAPGFTEKYLVIYEVPLGTTASDISFVWSSSSSPYKGMVFI